MPILPQTGLLAEWLARLSPATTSELPPYRVRRSARARHARLTVSQRDGVVAVLPQRAPARLAERMVRDNLAWIERHLQRIAALPVTALPELPAEIALDACTTRWSLQIEERRGVPLRLREEDGGLSLRGEAAGTPQAAAPLLQRWLSAQARGWLPQRVDQLAQQHGLRCGKVTIRAQRTRWGSCSARGNLSLNRKLLFLPPPLCDHVLLHELAHTRHLNHSPAFWHLLHELDPHCAHHRLLLRNSGHHIPAWAIWRGG